MRFAEPFTQAGKSPEAKLEAERLMFLELTQGSFPRDEDSFYVFIDHYRF